MKPSEIKPSKLMTDTMTLLGYKEIKPRIFDHPEYGIMDLTAADKNKILHWLVAKFRNEGADMLRQEIKDMLRIDEII